MLMPPSMTLGTDNPGIFMITKEKYAHRRFFFRDHDLAVRWAAPGGICGGGGRRGYWGDAREVFSGVTETSAGFGRRGVGFLWRPWLARGFRWPGLGCCEDPGLARVFGWPGRGVTGSGWARGGVLWLEGKRVGLLSRYGTGSSRLGKLGRRGCDAASFGAPRGADGRGEHHQAPAPQR